MKKYVELEKRSKKEQKAYYAAQRNTNGFNTGTRTMATDKSPSRARGKHLLKKEMRDFV